MSRYVADEEIIGISKLTRLVRVYARRFTVQERLGEQIADTLVDLIDPQGVAVHLEAAHLCTQMRGVNEESSRTVTTFWRGLLLRRRRPAPRVPRRGSRHGDDAARAPRGAGRLPSFDLPDELRELYPGTLGFPDEWLFANFVSTIDGVVSLPGVRGSNRLIADASEADRFVMGLLRACADVVLIGSGTLQRVAPRRLDRRGCLPGRRRGVSRATPRPRPAGAAGARDHHLGRGVSRRPSDPRAPPARPDHRRRRRTAAAVLPGADVVAVSAGERVDLTAAVAALRARGYGRILSEGGPHLFGSLLTDGLLDELFLTVSPLVAGRPRARGGALSRRGREPAPRPAGRLGATWGPPPRRAPFPPLCTPEGKLGSPE